MRYKRIPVPSTTDEVRFERVNRISNYLLLRFLTERTKFARWWRHSCKDAYRQAYVIAQKRGLI